MTKVESREQVFEMMLEQMSVSWEEMDKFIQDFEGTADTRSAWEQGWLESKMSIFKSWGNKIRVEKDVELSLTEGDIRSGVRDVLLTLREKVSYRSLLILSTAFSVVPMNDVLENTLSEPITIFGKKLGKGMKVSRAFGRLISDSKERDIFQTEFSMLIQSFKVSGKVVLSIDPIDLLTMAYSPDNAWRSCHHCVDGEFRAGAVSYILDDSTFVSYAYRRKAKGHGGIELPNKVWRQIGYISSDLDVYSLATHYPSYNKNNEETLVSLIQETVGKTSVIDEEFSSYTVEDAMDNRGSFHYNDITEGRVDSTRVLSFSPHFDDRSELKEGFEDGDITFYIGNDTVPGVSGYDIEYASDIS